MVLCTVKYVFISRHGLTGCSGNRMRVEKIIQWKKRMFKFGLNNILSYIKEKNMNVDMVVNTEYKVSCLFDFKVITQCF